MKIKRVAVYVDGFNLYHALKDLKEPHLKWLDLWSLSNLLLDSEDQKLAYVKYFSTYAKWQEDRYRRHQLYVEALQVRGVEFVAGKFKKKSVKCKVCQNEYDVREEKETDVNIGVHLVADALKDRFDRAIVISADTDLNGAVKHTRLEAQSKKISIVTPPKRKAYNRYAQFEIPLKSIRDSLLPDSIISKNNKKIKRPPEYDPY